MSLKILRALRTQLLVFTPPPQTKLPSATYVHVIIVSLLVICARAVLTIENVSLTRSVVRMNEQLHLTRKLLSDHHHYV